MQKTYCVYIATNLRNTVFYTGVTSNLIGRIWQHKNKAIKGFTEKYNICKLVYYENFNTPSDAISAEKKIKGWTRKKKIDLIKSKNPELKDLSEF
jgi:putative endonuclease